MESIMAEPITLTIDLDLDAYLVRHIGYDEDGEERTAPQTLEDVVLDQVVAGLIRQAVHDESTGYKDLRKRVQQVMQEEILAAVRPQIDEALSGPVRRTNHYGEPVDANPTTLRDMITEQVSKSLTMDNRRNSYGDRNQSVLSALVEKHVERQLGTELQAALAKAKAEVTAAVKAKGAEVLAETIRRAGATL
jgi:hypothetical protein